MPRRAALGAVSCLWLLFEASACGVGGHIGSGIARYRQGDYISAMQTWVELQNHQQSMNGKGVVRYLVFRGLTHYRQGEQALALHFLRRGRRAYRLGHPAWLPHRALVEMNQALGALEARQRNRRKRPR